MMSTSASLADSWVQAVSHGAAMQSHHRQLTTHTHRMYAVRILRSTALVSGIGATTVAG